MGMIDVSSKEVVLREAIAEGTLMLGRETLQRIDRGEIRKGDPFTFAEAAALLAVKQTHLLIPHCHPLPIEGVEVRFRRDEDSVNVRCQVKARARTGVEMEALVGVSMALNTLWDLVKYLEKDERGQYPDTRIADIRVVSKEKGAASS
jgi:cyclic pyranopterin phosphate synthase